MVVVVNTVVVDAVVVVDTVVVDAVVGAASSFLSVDSSIELMTSGNLQQLPK